MLGLHFTPACVLLLVCSLHFTLSLHFSPGPQSAVCSLQSAVCVLHWPITKWVIYIWFTGRLLWQLSHLLQNFLTTLIHHITSTYIQLCFIVIASTLCRLHTCKCKQRLSMIPSTSNKKPIFQGHNLPQVPHYHLHVQGQYQGRQGKVTRSGCKKWCSHNL